MAAASVAPTAFQHHLRTNTVGTSASTRHSISDMSHRDRHSSPRISSALISFESSQTCLSAEGQKDVAEKGQCFSGHGNFRHGGRTAESVEARKMVNSLVRLVRETIE
jgi:hypothetical protein